MKTKISLILLIIPQIVFSQFTISGYVKDTLTGENLIGAQVFDKALNKGVLTNNYGYFTLKVGLKSNLIINSIGYKTKHIQKNNDKNQTVVFYLNSNNLLSTVEVNASLPIEKQNEVSTLKIPIKLIKQLPTISGEADIMRAYHLMPGVSFGKEGTSGIYVRGGSPDQNLFILDDIPLYYVSHIGGFISVFDINAVNTMTLYKGGFPAKYGGRISSVVDFRMKEGNSKKIKAELGLGLVSTKLFIEGPIKKDTSSFFLSARRSNIDLFTRLVTFVMEPGKFSAGYTFWDVNGKYTRRINSKSKIQFITYLGRDRVFINSKEKDSNLDVKFNADDEIKWGNVMGQVKYTNAITPKLFNTSTIGVTWFKYNTEISAIQKKISTDEILAESSIGFLSSVFDVIAKSDFEYFANSKHKMQFGIEGFNHTFKPGVSSSKTTGGGTISDTITGSNTLMSQEIKLYFQDKIKFSPRFFVNLGLHFQTYFVQKQTLISLQPRFLLNYNVTEKSALRFAYSRMNQNVHLLSNSGTGLPTDLWVPATKNLKPELSDQFTIAYVQSVGKQYEFSIEAYYKQLQNLIDYKDGSTFLSIGDDWEKVVVGNGVGTVNGVELLVKKTQGKLQGWLGYTLSKNLRQFDDINNGNEFYYKYDRRHDLSLVGFYDINERVSLSATWVFSTGSPITLAQEKYDILVPGLNWNVQPGEDYITNNVNTAQIYHGKNAYRLPAYHKLDFGISFKKKKKRGLRTWQYGLYNLYNKQNPFFLYYKKVNNDIKLFQLSIFPIMPSFSYTFKFN